MMIFPLSFRVQAGWSTNWVHEVRLAVVRRERRHSRHEHAGGQRGGIDFINKLLALFSYESDLRSFSLITFRLCIIFGAKAACKMLMKLTKGGRQDSVKKRSRKIKKAEKRKRYVEVRKERKGPCWSVTTWETLQVSGVFIDVPSRIGTLQPCIVTTLSSTGIKTSVTAKSSSLLLSVSPI